MESELNRESKLTIHHVCYIIRSINTSHIEIGYTTNFGKTFRQYDEGIRSTINYHPYEPVCVISGFHDAFTARIFERLLKQSEESTDLSKLGYGLEFIINNLRRVIINCKDSTLVRWPHLIIYWNLYSDKNRIKSKKVTNVLLMESN
jgi:hypothetical protein